MLRLELPEKRQRGKPNKKVHGCRERGHGGGSVESGDPWKAKKRAKEAQKFQTKL